MSFEASIRAYFVTNREITGLSEDISTAFSYLKDHVKEENISLIKPSEGFALIGSGTLTKQDVFILEKFDGDFFKQLQQTKSLIIGPRCLTSCLLNCKPIPLGNSPVFTTAMRNLQISASGITPEEKEKLRVLISWMGGYYFQNFGRSITHLISNTVKSTKYEHATLNGIPVMHVDWVQRVWSRSSIDDVHATDEEFQKYKLPIFFGCNITCSHLDNDKKNEVMRLVNDNGGIYNRNFRSQCTDIVITENNKTRSDKYVAAVRYKKEILLPEWIFDSVKKGYALPTKAYQVASIKVSTPTKPDQSVADFQASDSTQLSDISRISILDPNAGNNGGDGKRDTTINETTTSLNNTKMSTVAQPDVHYKVILDNICPKKAKKMGRFLDGLSIYLSGFTSNEEEKLTEVLHQSGAVVYEKAYKNLTHIIVGEIKETDVKLWKYQGVNIVNLKWLLESIKLKKPAKSKSFLIPIPNKDEEEESLRTATTSKRALRSLNYSFKQPDAPPKKKVVRNDIQSHAVNKPIEIQHTNEEVQEDEEDILAQYSQENQPLPIVPLNQVSTSPTSTFEGLESTSSAGLRQISQPTNDAVNTMDYENLDFLQGMAVYVDGKHFDEDIYTKIIEECEAAQGNVVRESFRDPVDYVIVSFEKSLNANSLPVKPKNIVTELYIEDCMKHNKLIPIQYYHKHIPNTADIQPLRGMTIVTSTYSHLERDFIYSMAQLLGANINDAFVKMEKPLLICPSPEGSKYDGAMKWNYPVVTSDWLLKCTAKGQKIPYKKYLVGDSPDDFPISPTLRERNMNEIQKTETASPNLLTMQVEGGENNIELNSSLPRLADASSSQLQHFTPLRNKRVSELAGPICNSSPHTPINHGFSLNSKFFEDLLAGIDNEAERKCLRECIIEMQNNQTPEIERIRRQACTPINRKIPTPKGIPEFCTTPEYEKRIAAEFERRWRLPIKKLKPNTPIEEIRKRVFRATCKMYGIECSDDESSPVRTETEANHTPKPKFQPRSIYSMHSNSNRSELVASSQSPKFETSSTTSKSTINFDKISFEETSVASPEMKQISDYLRNCESKRQSSKQDSKFQLQEPEILETESHMIQPFQSEQFGGGTEEMVGWRDPTEFTLARRAKVHTMQYEGTPRFSISCSEDKRDDVISKILQLCGEVSEDHKSFDPLCTHLLCERPNRAEKLLGCMSSGKWILSLNYIDECIEKNVFVDEELFEWGNPKACNLPVLPAEEQRIVQATFRWRKEFSESLVKNPGAFTGMRVILRVSERILESIKNVIKAGKGEIIEAEPPYDECENIHKATHCFVDKKNAPLSTEDYKVLKKSGVQVFHQMYINAYLMKNDELEKFRINL